MPKKKKDKSRELIQETHHIENTTSTKGNVKITTYRGNVVYRTVEGHNNGTIYICEYLRDALAGDYVIARRPGLITPCRKVDGKLVDIGHGSTYNGEAKKNSFSVEDAGCSTTITFLIASDLTNGQQIDGFRLYSFDSAERVDEDKVIYAEIDLTKQENYDPNDPLVAETGVSMKVEWTLAIRFE